MEHHRKELLHSSWKTKEQVWQADCFGVVKCYLNIMNGEVSKANHLQPL